MPPIVLQYIRSVTSYCGLCGLSSRRVCYPPPVVHALLLLSSCLLYSLHRRAIRENDFVDELSTPEAHYQNFVGRLMKTGILSTARKTTSTNLIVSSNTNGHLRMSVHMEELAVLCICTQRHLDGGVEHGQVGRIRFCGRSVAARRRGGLQPPPCDVVIEPL